MGTPLGTPHLNPTPLASPGQLAAEHAVYADFIRTVLEVIDTIITTGQANTTSFWFCFFNMQSVCGAAFTDAACTRALCCTGFLHSILRQTLFQDDCDMAESAASRY